MHRGVGLLLIGGLLISMVPVVDANGGTGTPACSLCGDRFTDAAEIGVDWSQVLIEVRRDGGASWTVRNDFSRAGARDLRNHTNLTAVVVEALRLDGLPRATPADDGPLPVDNLSVTLEGDDLVIQFDHPGAATRHNGVVILRYFADNRQGYRVNADNYTILGPPGTTVTHLPNRTVTDGALRVERAGRRVTIFGRTDSGPPRVDREYSFDSRAWIAYAPANDPLGGAKTTVALARLIAPVALGGFLAFVLYPAILFGGGLYATARGLRAHARRSSGSDLRLDIVHVLVAAGVVGVSVIATDFAGAAPVVGLLTVYTTGSILAWLRPTREVLSEHWGRVLGAGIAVASAGAMVVLLHHAGAIWISENSFFRLMPFLLTIAGFLPLGGLLTDDGGRRAWAWGLVVAVLFSLFLSVFVDVTDPPTGLGAGIHTFVAPGIVILTLVFGIPMALLGYRLAGRSDPFERRFSLLP